MDVLVIIVGFYYLIKFITENRRSKLYQKDLDARLDNIEEVRRSLKNSKLIYEFINKPLHYSEARQLVHEAISRVCPNYDVSESELFGTCERRLPEDALLTGNKRDIALGLIMSKQGCLPVAWTIVSFGGMYFTNPEIGNGAQHNKEIYAIAKTIQKNLQKSGKNVHVIVNLHHDYPDIISNTNMYLEELTLSKKDSIRIDDFSIDKVLRE